RLAGRGLGQAHWRRNSQRQQKDNQSREPSRAQGLAIEHSSPYLLVKYETLPPLQHRRSALYSPATHDQARQARRRFETSGDKCGDPFAVVSIAASGAGGG